MALDPPCRQKGIPDPRPRNRVGSERKSHGMKFREIIARVSGLSSPVFGVSWNPPETEIAVARRVVSYLEDRRVLYNPSEMEVPDHCVEFVLDIRRFLTGELAPLAEDSEFRASLRAMRAACRKFLDTVGVDGRSAIVRFGAHRGHWASWEFKVPSGNFGASSVSMSPG